MLIVLPFVNSVPLTDSSRFGGARGCPSGAGFDSPGRLALGHAFHRPVEAPPGRDSLVGARAGVPLESRPVGACGTVCAGPQGCRPGLSNLARFGAVSLDVET